MSCSGLANVLSGVALICGPRRDRPSGGSYRDRYRPPQVVDRTITVGRRMTAVGRGRRFPLVRRTAGIGATRPVAWRSRPAGVAPKPTPMITLMNDEVGWKGVIR